MRATGAGAHGRAGVRLYSLFIAAQVISAASAALVAADDRVAVGPVPRPVPCPFATKGHDTGRGTVTFKNLVKKGIAWGDVTPSDHLRTTYVGAAERVPQRGLMMISAVSLTRRGVKGRCECTAKNLEGYAPYHTCVRMYRVRTPQHAPYWCPVPMLPCRSEHQGCLAFFCAFRTLVYVVHISRFHQLRAAVAQLV